ncbi:hypothetical protein [Specibacter sp. NPDC078709]|uniref:hypothetical protein n=1 Tax=Specibacter sp. NPDC078709 TaxID=3154364 RepID=UPI00342EBE27
MTFHTTRRTLITSLVLTSLVALTACASSPSAEPGLEPGPGQESSAVPHGFVAGATEADEAQVRLSYLSADSGAITMIDPLTGEEGFSTAVPGATSLSHDGRYIFVRTTPNAPLKMIDTGVWTRAHGDHSHFYSAAAHTVETDSPLPSGSARGDGNKVAIFDESTGTTSVLLREALDKGDVHVALSIPGTPHTGLAVPYKGHVLVTGAPGGDQLPTTVSVFDNAGASESLTNAACPSLRGHAITSYGVLFGCSDGVLIVSDDTGSLTAAKIPYPSTHPGTNPGERIESFGHRPGSSELTALAGTAGLWHLDAAAQKIQFIKSPEPLVTSTTAGNGTPALAVGTSGTVYAFNTKTIAVEAQADLLPATKTGQTPSLVVDNNRAYLSHPGTAKIYELDYRDHLRVARTFPTSTTPAQLVETGL